MLISEIIVKRGKSMMKRYGVLAIIIALMISLAAIGCSSESSKPKSTPTKTPAQTATPTATATPTTEPTTEPTETPAEVGQLPANYKFFMNWSDSEGISGEAQYWVKGEKWRTDYSDTQGGIATQMLLIYDGQFPYLYMPDLSKVYKYASSSEMANPGAAYAQDFKDGYYGNVSDTTMLAGFEAACSGGASIDGQETVNGTPCTKFTCNFSGGVSYTWISDSGWPVMVETTQEDGTTTTVQYSNIDLNPTIDDSIFDISVAAPGVEITDVP
jgi:outer membrane lipoprotein-sorting protein